MLSFRRARLTRWMLPAVATTLAVVALPTSPAQANTAVSVSVVSVSHTSFTVKTSSHGSGWK